MTNETATVKFPDDLTQLVELVHQVNDTQGDLLYEDALVAVAHYLTGRTVTANQLANIILGYGQAVRKIWRSKLVDLPMPLTFVVFNAVCSLTNALLPNDTPFRREVVRQVTASTI